MPTKIASFILNSEQKNNTLSDIYIAEPDAGQEELAGRLFILLEIEAKKAEAIKVADFLINYISESYYQDEKIMLKEKIGALKVENIFEAVLAKANKELADFLFNQRIKLNPQNISLITGLIYKQELHFSTVGGNRVYLIHKHEDEYRLVDICEHSREEIGSKPDHLKAEPSGQIKLFSNVINGEMPPESFFVFCNEALPEYLSNKELISIVTKLAPQGAAEQIKNTLLNINNYVPFLGIVCKNTTWAEENLAPVPSPKIINSLQAAEEQTEKILAPAGVINLKKIGEKISHNIDSLNIGLKKKTAIESIKEKGFFLKDKIFVKRQNSPISLAKLKNRLSRFSLSHLIYKIATFFKSFGGPRKKIAIALILVIVVLVVGITSKNIHNKKEAKKQNQIEISQKIEQKSGQIDSYLLYKNDDGAKAVANELKQLVESLPREKKDEIAYYSSALEKLNEQLAKIQHIEKITPSEFAFLGDYANPDSLAILNNNLYAVDNDAKKLYAVKNSDKSQSTIDFPADIIDLKLPANSEKVIYFLNKEKIAQLNTEDNKLSVLEIDLGDKANNTSDLQSYNGNIYALDKVDGKIYIYRQAGDKFNSREDWIKDGSTLSNPVSLAIDNSIYILSESGQVKKYLKGQAKDFNLETVDPALENANRLYVSPESKYILVLDKTNKRVIVFDKDGKFQKQYRFDLDIKDLTINPNDGTSAYLLSGNKIYNFSIQ